jgi:hypothetical protein
MPCRGYENDMGFALWENQGAWFWALTNLRVREESSALLVQKPRQYTKPARRLKVRSWRSFTAARPRYPKPILECWPYGIQRSRPDLAGFFKYTGKTFWSRAVVRLEFPSPS